MKMNYATVLLFITGLTSIVFGLTDKTWTGSTSADWFISSNWSPSGVPTNDSRVYIPAASNAPVIDGYRWGVAGEVNIGGALTLQGGGGLSINNGSGNLNVGWTTAGYLYVKGGRVYCNYITVKPGAGWGQAEIESGRVVCSALSVNGRVNLKYFAGCVVTPYLAIGTGAAVELHRGRLMLAGNQQTAIQNFISAGKIYMASGAVLYDYNLSQLGYTTAYATGKTVSNPIVWSGVNNATIENLFIRNTGGHAIKLTNCSNITVRNCEFQASGSTAVYIVGGSGHYVYYNTFRDCAGGVCLHSTAGYGQITNNWVLNNLPRMNWSTPIRGNALQIFNSNGPELKVNYNKIDHLEYQSDIPVCDNINVYNSSGTVSSLIEVKGNWIRCWGGGSTAGNPYGAGAAMFDGGNCEFQRCSENYMVNANYAGIGLNGGRYGQFYNNLIYSDGISLLGTGGFSGVIINDYLNVGNCHDHWLWSNHVYSIVYYQYNGQWYWYAPGYYNSGNITNVYNDASNIYEDTTLSWNILPGNMFSSVGPGIW